MLGGERSSAMAVSYVRLLSKESRLRELMVWFEATLIDLLNAWNSYLVVGFLRGEAWDALGGWGSYMRTQELSLSHP
jgi:hypothetical protein